MDAPQEYYNNLNNTYTSFPNDSIKRNNISEDISSHNASGYLNLKEYIFISVFVICIVGAVGNGMVIWLLGFRIKRNPFITYILNLAVADFGLLVSTIFMIVSVWIRFQYPSHIILHVFSLLFLSMYSAGQFLLTAISIDRCVAVFFPLWHQCRRPPRLSTIVCALIWVISLLLIVTVFIIEKSYLHKSGILIFCQFIVNAALCLPLMTSATLALFIKVCFKARQQRRGKLLTIILITLFFFILLVFPLNVIYVLNIYHDLPPYFLECACSLSCINSSVNPVIYFLIGRQWKSRHKETMKMVLQRVFKEEERCTEEIQL
ncbi:mas-related G-protein coupled receptor member H-like [Eublepharis macularius]|uniref:Mas-related G-protein coupled receptor member H-like n=1 Tax=Eublepharis macularius TaxID=481883 RepID=A0AA97JMW7_EUBMA|nr:mas-related G-protein coupled receptor member H-like [Eublepharis macularius]